MIKGDSYVCVLLYDPQFSAFIAGEAYVVLLFELFYSLLVCFVNIRPLLLGLQCFKSDLEFMMNPLQLVFKFVFRLESVDVSDVWIGEN